MAGGLAAILNYEVAFGMETRVGKLKEPASVAKRLHRLIQPALTACLGNLVFWGREWVVNIFFKFLFKHLKITSFYFLSQNTCNSLGKDTDAGKD